MKLRLACMVTAFLSLVLSLSAQTTAQAPPPLIQFSNVATDEGGNTLSGVINITFSLYNAQQGGESLRLDCVASNGRLRAYYEAAGFVHRGDATVAGAPGQRLDEGPVTVVSRYEQRLGPAGCAPPYGA